MLVYNKYLQELGVKPTDYPFNKATEPDEDGIIPEHLWDLDRTMTMELYTYIKAFQERRGGIPACYTEKQWDAILQKIVDGLAWKVMHGQDFVDTPGFKEGNTSFWKALHLLFENWNCFWD